MWREVGQTQRQVPQGSTYIWVKIVYLREEAGEMVAAGLGHCSGMRLPLLHRVGLLLSVLKRVVGSGGRRDADYLSLAPHQE